MKGYVIISFNCFLIFILEGFQCHFLYRALRYKILSGTKRLKLVMPTWLENLNQKFAEKNVIH